MGSINGMKNFRSSRNSSLKKLIIHRGKQNRTSCIKDLLTSHIMISAYNYRMLQFLDNFLKLEKTISTEIRLDCRNFYLERFMSGALST